MEGSGPHDFEGNELSGKHRENLAEMHSYLDAYGTGIAPERVSEGNFEDLFSAQLLLEIAQFYTADTVDPLQYKVDDTTITMKSTPLGDGETDDGSTTMGTISICQGEVVLANYRDVSYEIHFIGPNEMWAEAVTECIQGLHNSADTYRASFKEAHRLMELISRIFNPEE
jgi:hypothetical protein